jgi:quercetin dioxygenase-like cupin family protein
MTLRRILAATAAASLLIASAAAAETVKLVFRKDLPNAPGKTFSVVEVDFPPGGSAAPHRHRQAFVYAYVLSGVVRSQLGDEPARSYHAGESWFEPPGAHHVETRNLSSVEPARILVVFVADPKAELKTDDPSQELHP